MTGDVGRVHLGSQQPASCLGRLGATLPLPVPPSDTQGVHAFLSLRQDHRRAAGKLWRHAARASERRESGGLPGCGCLDRRRHQRPSLPVAAHRGRTASGRYAGEGGRGGRREGLGHRICLGSGAGDEPGLPALSEGRGPQHGPRHGLEARPWNRAGSSLLLGLEVAPETEGQKKRWSRNRPYLAGVVEVEGLCTIESEDDKNTGGAGEAVAGGVWARRRRCTGQRQGRRACRGTGGRVPREGWLLLPRPFRRSTRRARIPKKGPPARPCRSPRAGRPGRLWADLPPRRRLGRLAVQRTPGRDRGIGLLTAAGASGCHACDLPPAGGTLRCHAI